MDAVALTRDVSRWHQTAGRINMITCRFFCRAGKRESDQKFHVSCKLLLLFFLQNAKNCVTDMKMLVEQQVWAEQKRLVLAVEVAAVEKTRGVTGDHGGSPTRLELRRRLMEDQGGNIRSLRMLEFCRVTGQMLLFLGWSLSRVRMKPGNATLTKLPAISRRRN